MLNEQISIGPKLIQVPYDMVIDEKPKLVDFTTIDMYPSKYKIIDGKAHIKSLNIENIHRQHEALKAMNTTVLVGDSIKVDFKFGHYEKGTWYDYYVKGIFKVKRILPLKVTCEIAFLVVENKSNNEVNK